MILSILLLSEPKLCLTVVNRRFVCVQTKPQKNIHLHHLIFNTISTKTQKTIFIVYNQPKRISIAYRKFIQIFIDYIQETMKVETAMSDITRILGQRIRNYRTSQGLSQEKLAELSGCHPTYIGQIERAEKNATIESIEKISSALNVPLSKLFEKLGSQENKTNSIPLACYEFLSAKTKTEQERLYRILLEIDDYKKN